MSYFACTREGQMRAWYELDVGDNGRAIVIRIVHAAWEFVKRQLQKDLPLVTALQEGHRLSPFVKPTEGNWGFGQVAVPFVTQPEWVAFKYQIPNVFTADREKPQWQDLCNITATIQVLTACLYLCSESSTKSQAQLLEFSLDCGHGPGRWPVFAGVSPAMCRWIAQQSETSRQPEICQYMENAHRQLFGRSRLSLDRPYILATIRQPSWISLCCPGDACDLSPEDLYTDLSHMNRGYGLHPHSMDTPMQQLTMIVGLAAMHKLARTAGF